MVAQQDTIAQTHQGLISLPAPKTTTPLPMQATVLKWLMVTTVLEVAKLRVPLATILDMVLTLAKCVQPASTVLQVPITLSPAMRVPTRRVTARPLLAPRAPTSTTAPRPQLQPRAVLATLQNSGTQCAQSVKPVITVQVALKPLAPLTTGPP